MSSKKTTGVFPGQGSQSLGMGKELFENFKIYKETLEEASDSLSLDFKKLCFEGPVEDLNLTENTQPAIVAASTGAYRVLNSEFGFKPQLSAGHSVGEYSALVAAGVLSFSEALQAVKLRGASMQKAVPLGEGAMSALLGPSNEQAVELCKWVQKENPGLVMEAANFNCPGQVVISGHQKAMDWLKTNIKSYEFNPAPKKVRLIPLKVSAPFHCSLMMSAQEKMAEHFESVKFNAPSFQLIQNVSAEVVEDPEQIKENLISQVSSSVLWTKTVENMMQQEAEIYIEVGSGSTLSGLIKKIDTREIKIFNTNSLESIKEVSSFL